MSKPDELPADKPAETQPVNQEKPTETESPAPDAKADETKEDDDFPLPNADDVEEDDDPDNPETPEKTDAEGDDTEEPDDKEGGDDEEAKRKEEARKHYEERQKQKQEETQFLQDLEKDVEDYYVDADADPAMQEVQKLKAREFMRDVKAARNNLVVENERVQTNIPMFNPGSEDFNQAAYNHLLTQFEAAYCVKDKNGQILGARASFYDYMKSNSDLLDGARQSGTKKGQEHERRMRANADTTPANKPKETKKDDISQIWDKDD